jgi:predicted permease
MSLRGLPQRFSGMFHKQSRDRELDAELECHLRMQTDENISQGMSREQARRAAIIRSGGIESAKESYRDRRGLPVMETTLQDVRYGLRMLRRSPGSTAIAVLTLALGIGANTAIFSVVNAVLVKPLPYANSSALVAVFLHSATIDQGAMGFADFEALRDQQQSFEAVACSSSPDEGFALTGQNAPEEIPGTEVTSAFFTVLGVRPMLGRLFLPGEDQVDQPLTVVVSSRFWRDHLRSDPAAVGRPITLNQKPYTVVGVTPPDFHFGHLDNDELWPILPLPTPQNRFPYFFHVIGRLRPGVSTASATADATRVAASVDRRFPSSEHSTAIAQPLKDVTVGNSRTPLLILLAAAALVLLIAIVNVANLQIARAAARHKETAVRTALGASRVRLIRQALTESILLGLIGGALGVAFAYLGVTAILRVDPTSIPRVHEISVDSSVLAFSAAVAIVAGILFGLVPVFLRTDSRIDETLKQSGRATTEGLGSRRLHNALVVTEFSLAMILLTGAGLLVRNLVGIETVSPGFTPAHIITMQLSLPPAHYTEASKVTLLYDRLLQSIQGSAGVESVAISMSLPPNLLEVGNPFHVEGQPYDQQRQQLAEEIPISEDYFRTLGVPLIAGRFFNQEDRARGRASLIVNQTMAQRYFPHGDAVGKRLQTGDTNPGAPWETIVGVVGNVKYQGLDEKEQPTLYVPFHVEGWSPFFVRSMFLIVRTQSDPANVTAFVRSRLALLDADVPVYQVRTMDELLSESVSAPRFRMLLLVTFAGLALLLAAIGTYGVLAYAVERRTQEFGVRVALGAQQRDVMALVLCHGTLLALVGITIGVAGALALTGLMASLLFGVTPRDPLTFVLVPLALFVVALAASYIPARRAMRVDPVVALRHE